MSIVRYYSIGNNLFLEISLINGHVARNIVSLDELIAWALESE